MGLRAIELFAGVGGFRLGLERAEHEVVWSNQWEPGKKKQHASDCYVRHFGSENHLNDDVTLVDAKAIPDHDLLVGGFPCQDYSVAKTLSHAKGLEGKKGVLWWEIRRIAEAKRPPYLLLENVDRLLKSPATQRGRDMGVMLRCLADLDYVVEWRVVNAADYSFPQKRRRVFIFAAQRKTAWAKHIIKNAARGEYLRHHGFFASEFPVERAAVALDQATEPNLILDANVQKVSDEFEYRLENAGAMVDGKVWTKKVTPARSPLATLGGILEKHAPEQYYVSPDGLDEWKYLKGAKREKRTAKNGFQYEYVEGPIPFPDNLDTPSRTMLTSEGGTKPSRSNHLILDPWTKRYRCLTPVECERLNGFPDGWTEGMSDRWRYFTMGNALVVGLIERMGRRISQTPTKVEAAKGIVQKQLL